MRIEDILEQWKVDSVIDNTNVGEEGLKFGKLHHKYYTIFSTERLRYRKLQSDMKLLKLQKHEFYTQGPDEESQAKGWKIPAIGKIIKNDVDLYIDGDPDIIDLNLKMGIQLEKMELLESIIKALQNRGFAVRNYIEFLKFTNAG